MNSIAQDLFSPNTAGLESLYQYTYCVMLRYILLLDIPIYYFNKMRF